MNYREEHEKFRQLAASFLEESKRVGETNTRLALLLAGVSHTCLLSQMFCSGIIMIEAGLDLGEPPTQEEVDNFFKGIPIKDPSK